MSDPDFSKIFGTNADSAADLTDVNYLKGWGFLGAEPPTYQNFDSVQKKNDAKMLWLYNKLKNKVRIAGKTYSAGDIIWSESMSSNLFAYCITGGTISDTEPTWPAEGLAVEDGAVTWKMRAFAFSDSLQDMIDSLSSTYDRRSGDYIAISSSVTLTSSQSGYRIQAITASIAITMPAVSAGLHYTIFNNSLGEITLSTPATFIGPHGNSETSLSIPAGVVVDIYSDGSNWIVFMSSGSFVGATSETNGKSGGVPVPAAGQENSVLLGSGVWEPLANLAVVSGFSVNATANGGHLTFPAWLGGLTIEWGNTADNYSGGTVVFPKPFTTIFQVYAITGSQRDENVCPNNISNTQFDIQTQGVTQGVCRWFAIGIA